MTKHTSQVKDQQGSKQEEELQAELDMTKPSSQAKNQRALKLEEELQAKQKAMAFLADQFEQQQRELEMLKQQGKARVCGAECKYFII